MQTGMMAYHGFTMFRGGERFSLASSGPNVLGINRTQDGSICLISAGRLVFAIQKERLTRQKHDWGKLGDVSKLYAPLLQKFAEPIDLVVECYSSDVEFNKLADYREELYKTIRFRNEAEIVIIPHHLAHLYSAAPISGFKNCAAMMIDFMGSPVAHLEDGWSRPPLVSDDDVEIASFYDWENETPLCLSKHLWDRNRQHGVGLGFFYQTLAQSMFPGEGNEGKVMGLAAYGNKSRIDMPNLTVEEGQVTIPPEWFDLFACTPPFSAQSIDDPNFTHCADAAAVGQAVFETALLELANWLCRSTGKSNLCFAGGTALNCVANSRLQRESLFDGLFIPPAPNDAGTAIGCALYGVQVLPSTCNSFRWRTDFLGPAIDLQPANLPAIVSNRVEWSQPKRPISVLVELLCGGAAIGIVQGGAEFGPRALGHRSILADPTHDGMKDWINANIKGREWFRPLAPMVLESEANVYFDLDVLSPHMLYTYAMKPAAIDGLPAVKHVDSTARVQTVGPDDDKFIFELLKAMKVKNGHGVLLNTSFNGQDEPIVENLEQALECLLDSGLSYVYAPPYLFGKKQQN